MKYDRSRNANKLKTDKIGHVASVLVFNKRQNDIEDRKIKIEIEKMTNDNPN